MIICGKCGMTNEDHAKFCVSCGNALTQNTDQQPFQEEQRFQQQQQQAPTPQRTNGMAVAGFVLSFFISILGLIFSAVGIAQCSKTGEGGKGLAIAGLVLSILGLVGWFILLMEACVVGTGMSLNYLF